MLHIIETKNNLVVQDTPNNLDGLLGNDIPEPLPTHSGFNMLIAGSSGSGKTTLLYSIMTKKRKHGIRQSYLKIFHKIYIISPTLGGESMKADIFSKLPGNQKWRSLTIDALEGLRDALEENRKDNRHSIVILDDVGSTLKKSAAVEKTLISLMQNRRHLYTSFITLVQRLRDVPTGIRNNLSHFASFRPRNRPELEAICQELIPFDRKKCSQLFSHIFDNETTSHPFLFIDMSLKKSNKFLYYSGFNPLSIEDPDDHS